MAGLGGALACLWGLTVCCGRGVSDGSDGAGGGAPSGLPDAVAPVSVAALSEELPLPDVPAALHTPSERVAYVLAHFWDGLDFSVDTMRGRSRDFMEQNFVNFLSLFPYADTAALRSGVAVLTRRSACDTAVCRLVADLACQYLYEPNSPMRQEDYLIVFLEELLRTPVLPPADQYRAARLLASARKNRPGQPAADFAYLTRDGRPRTLSTTPGVRTLLIFYDPLCGHCAGILSALEEDGNVSRRAADGTLTVLAVCAEDDRAAWDSTKFRLPAAWTVGFDASGELQRRRLYDLPAMPALYLLDGDKTVLLKDASLPAVLGALR